MDTLNTPASTALYRVAGTSLANVVEGLVTSVPPVFTYDSNNNLSGFYDNKTGLPFTRINDSLDRPPTYLDNTALGYSASSAWQYAGKVFQPIGTPDTGSAAWMAQPPVGGGFVDVVGTANVEFAGGFKSEKRGYTGNCCDITVTISGTPTVATFTILATGECDKAGMLAFMTQADAGTYPTITKLYDHNGGSPAIKNASYAAPFIEWDDALQEFVIVGTSYTASTPCCLQLPAGNATTGNSFGVFFVGRASSSGDGSAVYSLGDPTTSPNNFNALVAFGGGYLKVSNSVTNYGTNPPIYADSQSSVYCVTNNGSAVTMSQDEQVVTNSFTSDTLTYDGGWIGALNPASSSANSGVFRLTNFCYSSIPLTSAMQKSLRWSYYSRYNIFPQMQDKVYFVGDSRTAGTISTNISIQSAALQLCSMMKGKVKVVACGLPGANTTTIGQIVTNIVAARNTAAKETVVYLGGVNDLIQGATSASVVSNIQTQLAQLTAVGYTVILMNELATTNTTNGANTKMPVLRAGIAAQGASGMGASYLIDLLQYTCFTQPSNTAYYPDGLHPTSGLQEIWASTLLPYIAGFAPKILTQL